MAGNQSQYYLAIIKNKGNPFHHVTALCRRDTNTKQIKIEHMLSIRMKHNVSTILAPFTSVDAWVVEYEDASKDKKSPLKKSYPLSMITALAPLSAQAAREYTRFSQAYAYQYYDAALKLIPIKPLIKSDKKLRQICNKQIKSLEGYAGSTSQNVKEKIRKTGAPSADCHRFTRAVFKSHTGFYQDQLKGGLPLPLLRDLTSHCKLNAVLAANDGPRDRRLQAFEHFKRYTLSYFSETARKQFDTPDFDVNTMSDDMLLLLKSELSKLALKRHTLPPLFRFQSVPKELQAAIQGGCYKVDTSSVRSTVRPLLLSWAGVVLTVAVMALVAVAACSLMVSRNATSSLAVLKHVIIHSFEQAPGVSIGITAVSGVGSLVSSIGLLAGGGMLFDRQQRSLLALDITGPSASKSE